MDYVLVSKALAKKVDARVNADKKRKPHIERGGLSFNPRKDGTIRDVSFKFFEPDAKYQKGINGQAPAPVKIAFDFPRQPLVKKDPKKPISDHAPLKVWF